MFKRGGKALADVIPGLGKMTFDEDIGTIFITSGTGVIGYRVALSLVEAGVKNVRVGIWTGDRQVSTWMYSGVLFKYCADRREKTTLCVILYFVAMIKNLVPFEIFWENQIMMMFFWCAYLYNNEILTFVFFNVFHDSAMSLSLSTNTLIY
jgi:hypothetical protein